MKQLFSILFFLTFSVSLLAQTNTLNFTDNNNLKQGYWEENEGNNLINSGIYIDDRRDGNWIMHYKTGMLHKLEHYSKGLKNGISIEMDNRGYFLLEEYYKNNLLDGESVQYKRGGVKKSVTE